MVLVLTGTFVAFGCEGERARPQADRSALTMAKGADATTRGSASMGAAPATASGYSVYYGVPEVAGIRAALERVRQRLDTAQTPRVINRQTREEVTDFSKPAPNVGMDTGPEGKFNPISYPMGVINSGMINAYEVTGDKRYADYTAKWYSFYAAHLDEFSKWPMGRGNGGGGPGATNPFRNFYEPDSLDACGAMTAAMIKARMAGVGPDMKRVIDVAVDFVHTKQFRLPDATLARHRPIDASLWGDDMYMGGSILGQAGRMTGDAAYFDDAAKQVLQMSKYLWVPEAQLFTHATNTVSGSYQPHYYWGRANGWCLMEMAELLTVLPENHPQREAVLKQFRALAQGIQSRQAGDGFWHQLLDREDSYTETSATAMFTFAFARGVDKGWLEAQTYGAAAIAGWNAVASRIDRAGHVTGTCVGTSYASDYPYYYHRPATDDIHGYGPTLLAGSEMIRMLEDPKLRSNQPGGNGYVGFGSRREERR